MKKLMDASGLTTSNIIRKLLEGVEVTPRPTEHTIALLRELSAIGNNINQIARDCNSYLYRKEDKELLIAYMKKMNQTMREAVEKIGSY